MRDRVVFIHHGFHLSNSVVFRDNPLLQELSPQESKRKRWPCCISHCCENKFRTVPYFPHFEWLCQ
ncbi:hypothetical protein QJS04_geneDACA013110 [Acorus gramineus]|uniref:Uncharacterized protein n=1 Tax=Acorus gramineus TaxID=55184 RepID=A0AAV9B4D4_ACOGR|nr:hypothetical protein QJS04_geneDACA013110 [Acorus gramineus]